MDIILVLLSIVVFIIAVILALIAFVFAFCLLPTLLGIVACVSLWRSGHDNLGLIVLVGSFGVNVTLWRGFVIDPLCALLEPKGIDGSNPQPPGTRKVYDKHGTVKGYVEK